MNYDHFFASSLNAIKKEGRYRIFADLKRKVGEFPYALNYHKDGIDEVVVWCSNDYLAMGQHPAVLQAMQDALHQCGAGSGGTRNISGTTHYHVMLERELCYLHRKPSALLFTSGYIANEATLSTLGRHLPDCVFLSDEDNHASMIQGMRHSGAQKAIFRHHDMKHLESLLKEHPASRAKIIAFESVYSMNGDIAPISDIVQLAKKYNALTYLDEVHAVGIYGRRGAGQAEAQGCLADIDIVQGTLAKALGTIGGYIAASQNLTDFIRSHASSFIFTTSLPPAIAAGAFAALRQLKKSDQERQKLFDHVTFLKQELTKAAIPFLNHDSHIIPIIIGDPHRCKEVTDTLLNQFRIYVQPINYPTVPRGSERIRITPTPKHDKKLCTQLVTALHQLKKEGILTNQQSEA